MASRIPAEEIKHNQALSVYFDANIWLFNFCPLGDYKQYQVTKYSSALSTILNKKYPIYTSFSTISEFVNRYLKIAGDCYKATHNITDFNYKKDFRGSTEFKNALDDVRKQVGKIVKYSTVLTYPHTPDSIMDCLDTSMESVDFNDQEIIKFCKQHNLSLLTDDADFIDADITIISANGKYFQ